MHDVIDTYFRHCDDVICLALLEYWTVDVLMPLHEAVDIVNAPAAGKDVYNAAKWCD